MNKQQFLIALFELTNYEKSPGYAGVAVEV